MATRKESIDALRDQVEEREVRLAEMIARAERAIEQSQELRQRAEESHEAAKRLTDSKPSSDNNPAGN